MALLAIVSQADAALTHKYTFNGNANDSVGEANGSLLSGASLSPAGKVQFDGVNDYVSLPGPQINIDTYVDATFEGWFTMDTPDNWQRVFDFGRSNGGNGGNYVFFTPSSGFGDNRAAISNSLPGGGQENVAVGGPTLQTGQEYHFAVVVDDDANGGSQTFSLYLNGMSAGSTALTRSLSGVRDTLAYLGRSLYSADAFFDGSINEFRIYDAALSPADILASYQLGPELPELLVADVYSSSGQVVLRNISSSPLSFKHYQLSSVNGALDVAGWNSLSDQGIDATGPGIGQSWDEAGGSSSQNLAEYFLGGSSTLATGEELWIGTAYNPAEIGVGELPDVKLQFALDSGDVVQGKVNYVAEDADFDNDGDVDGRDFLRWQRNFGVTVGATNAMGDADGNGTVDQIDLASWQSLYGMVPAPLAGTAVPEPSALVCLLPVAICCGWSRKIRGHAVLLFSSVAVLAVSAVNASAATYHVERLTTDLHIPVYATTAPGDNDRVFVLELGGTASHASDGDPITTGEGRIVIYDRTSGQVDYNNPYLVINDTSLFEGVATPEVGLFSLAFHPDFQTNGKFYVNVAVNHTGPPPMVDTRVSPFKTVVREYTAASPGGNQANPTQVRTIFELNQPQFNHNGSWIGFNPTEVAVGNNYLYITQGDGGDQNDPANYGQNFDSWFGSIMRIDVDGDDFPADPSRNYAIPADNPFVGMAGADELWAKGLRNPWRASFDRATGDMWIGDVGQNVREEIDFIANGGPGGLNFGWRLREGTIATPTGGVGGPAPPGAVNPVYEYLHNGPNPSFQGASVTGGYVYRGSVPEFQGRYFFSDAVSGNIWSFDPSDPQGTVQWMNDLLSPDAGSIISVVSFGEDEEGELFIVDGAGQLFQIVPNLAITLKIDRESGVMSLVNETGSAQTIRGYTIESDFGAINPDLLLPITDRHDAPPVGDGTIDPNDDWQIISPAGSHSVFAEESLGDGGLLPASGEPVVLSLEDGWIPSPQEDLRLFVTLGDGTEVEASVLFSANDGEAFRRSDLNFDGDIDEDDWLVFIEHNLEVLSGLSLAQAYGRGDLDSDGDNDVFDFLLFEADFDNANGPGALRSLFGPQVPEPACLMIGVIGVILSTAAGRRRF